MIHFFKITTEGGSVTIVQQIGHLLYMQLAQIQFPAPHMVSQEPEVIPDAESGVVTSELLWMWPQPPKNQYTTK